MLMLSLHTIPPPQLIDEPRGCIAQFLNLCRRNWDVKGGGRHAPLPGRLEALAGHNGSERERPEPAVPRRHGPSIEQCSGPCHAICPRARGSRDRWTSCHAREVSSSLGHGGMCAKTHQPLLVPPSSDVQGPRGTAENWPRMELDKHGHLLTTLLLEPWSLQPWSPGRTASGRWK